MLEQNFLFNILMNYGETFYSLSSTPESKYSPEKFKIITKVKL